MNEISTSTRRYKDNETRLKKLRQKHKFQLFSALFNQSINHLITHPRHRGASAPKNVSGPLTYIKWHMDLDLAMAIITAPPNTT